jgi:hypothetical protein
MTAPPPPLSPEARALLPLLRDLESRLRAIVLRPGGRTDKSRGYNASRAALQLALLRRRIRELGATAAQVLGRDVRDRYRAGLINAERQARDAGVKTAGPITGAFTGADTARAEVLIRDGASDLVNKGVNSMVAYADRAARQVHAVGLNDAEVNRLVAGGTIEGRPDQTIRQVRELVQRVATKGMVEVINPRTGLVTVHKADDYAELVFNCKGKEAFNVATVRRLADRGIDLVRIIGSLSPRFCTTFRGKVYSISGTHPLYPPLASLPGGGPPFHPRCTKSVVAFVPELATEQQLAEAMPTPAAAALAGKSAAEAQAIHEGRTYRPRGPRLPRAPAAVPAG